MYFLWIWRACVCACVCFVDLFSSFAFCFRFVSFVCLCCLWRKEGEFRGCILPSVGCLCWLLPTTMDFFFVALRCCCWWMWVWRAREREREEKTESVVVVVVVQRSRRSTRQMCCVLSLFRCVASKEGAGRYSHDVLVHVCFTRLSLNLFSCFVSSVGCFFPCLFGDLSHDLQGNSWTDRQTFLWKRDCYRARRAVGHSLDLHLLCGAYLLWRTSKLVFPTLCALALPLADLRASISLVMLAGFEVWYALRDIHEKSGRNQKRRDCERTVLRCPATRLKRSQRKSFCDSDDSCLRGSPRAETVACLSLCKTLWLHLILLVQNDCLASCVFHIVPQNVPEGMKTMLRGPDRIPLSSILLSLPSWKGSVCQVSCELMFFSGYFWIW